MATSCRASATSRLGADTGPVVRSSTILPNGRWLNWHLVTLRVKPAALVS